MITLTYTNPPTIKPFRLLAVLLKQNPFKDLMHEVWKQRVEKYDMFRV